MARRAPAKDIFVPKNPEKYIGDRRKDIIYRSSWEHVMMRLFDEHPYVLGWASEPISIPYLNPVTGRHTVYIPDFLVVYADKNGGKHCELIEVKPAKESPAFVTQGKGKKSERLRLTQMINGAKWQAAARYCAKQGIKFRVASEDEMFAYSRNKK
jgi:hypothetical protein